MADRKGLEREREPELEHRELQELLPWYVNGTLEPVEREAVERHLKACAACRYELEELRGLQAAVSSAPEAETTAGVGVEIALQRTLARIGARGAATPRTQRRRRKLREWLFLPRPALALPVLALIFLGLGVVLGVQLALRTPVIGDFPGPGEHAAPLTERYFAYPRQILGEGTFTLRVGERPLLQEAFTLEQVEDGTLLLTSNVRALQSGDLTAAQRFKLTSAFRPLSYSLQGPLVYGGSRADASFTREEAILTVCCTLTEEGQQIQRRLIPLPPGEEPVLYDFSVLSHFEVLYRVIAERLRRGASVKELRFTALTPQALRAEPLVIERVEPAALLSDGRRVDVTRYVLRFGSEENPFRVELYALDTEEVLLAVNFPAQPRLPSSEANFAYRSDLYPNGLRSAEEER